ncbi:synaptotagmin-like protein 2 isoform X2 [Heptranchias perlo]|uniref:synaptotagmin-like protein 2 isoform X2 n=1 Tax=Heptranchias perlo TaxID=212740 RepID=UPI00355A4896
MKGVMDSNLDLSFLTEDEYQTVLKVIQRDSELKKKDSERIRTAQKSIQDEKRRKLVTGQWFDEVKAKRYRNSLLGVDLIKASIRREKPIKHDITEKTESQQAHLTPSFPIPTLPETAKNEYTSVSTDETTEESQSEEEKITARRKIKVKPGYPQDIQRKSLYDPRVSSSNESSPAAVAVETPVFPEKGQHRIPAVSSAESPTCEQAPDLRKQDNVAAIHYDRTQAYQADEISDQRTAPTAGSTLIPRAQRHLEFTEETPKAPGESEHSNLNGQRLATVSTVASPMQEKALDVRKPRKTVATRYNGAPTYQIPETSDQRKMAPSSITRIPKRRSSSRESETLSNEKPETLASEPGPQRLPAAILNEDQQAHQTIERSDQPPTSRIPRLKIALETAGETPKAPVEDLKPSSRMLPGKNWTAEMTDQAKAAFQPTSRIAKCQSSSSDDEREKGHKPGSMFTISALSNKHAEEETLTDPNHFKNLKHFWERGIDSRKANNDLPSGVSKIPFRKLRSPDYRGSPTEIKHSTLAESKSDLVTRKIPPTNSSPKLELQGNQSVPHSSEEEGEAVQLTRTSKLPPVPAPRVKPIVKMVKNDTWVTKWDKHIEANPSMVDEASKTVVQRTHSNDDQTKDSVAPESFEHGRPTTMRLSKNSSLDESLPLMKSSLTAPDYVVEETIKKEILPPKDNQRKEMYKKLRKMAAESAMYDPVPVEELTMIKADDEVCNKRPILLDNDHKSEMRTPVDGYTVSLHKENHPFAKEKDEEITPSSSLSDIPTLKQEVIPVKNDNINISLKSQVEVRLDKSSEGDITESETILMPRSVTEESTSLCKKSHSADKDMRASSTDELQCSVNMHPIINSKALPFTGTQDNGDDLSGNAVNSNSRSQEEQSSNVIHCMDDSESNDGFQRMESGSTYGLSPVMRALARAKKANAKSMDNLSSTIDRETITSVNENETKKDADDKPPVIHAPALEHARLKELSKSVPMLISESESDSASEVSFNFGWHRKTASDASHSSDMASVSSVSGSIMSVYSGDFGSIDTQGSVQFALDYSEKNKEFQIYVSQCKDLAIVDERKGRTDAYVKTYLLPDKARMGKRKTSVKRRNIKPLYNEILKYKIEKSVLLIQKLNLSVWHNDSLGRNSFLGEVDVDLASWDWSNRELNWYLLKSRIPAVGVGIDHRGEINLAIKYIPPGALGTGDPPTGEVHIWMKNAKDLPQLRSSGVDSFVKCYVLPDTSKKSYQKTRIVKKDTNPIYNHTIVYDGFRTEDLKEACVELTVWDHEKLTNHFLGGLRLGFGTGYSYGIPVEWMDSTEEEVSLWKEMMSNPNEWIPGSLLLRSQLGGKKLK